jgi:hypothetical protein
MTQIGKPQRIIEIPDPVEVPDYPPEQAPAEPVTEPVTEPSPREPVPA